jgi:hypothetical protein
VNVPNLCLRLLISSLIVRIKVKLYRHDDVFEARTKLQFLHVVIIENSPIILIIKITSMLSIKVSVAISLVRSPFDISQTWFVAS